MNNELVLILVGGGLLWWAMRKPHEEPAEVLPLTIEIIPAGMGSRGIAGITGDLVEGSTGNVARVTVTNTTTKAGVPWPYTFKVEVDIAAGGADIFSEVRQVTFAAGETKAIDFVFNVPAGRFGSGNAYAMLLSTNEVELYAEASANFTVAEADVIPGGGITW